MHPARALSLTPPLSSLLPLQGLTGTLPVGAAPTADAAAAGVQTPEARSPLALQPTPVALAPAPEVPSTAPRALRVVGGIASAPVKLLLTPVCGAAVGAAFGALCGAGIGGSILPMVAIGLTDGVGGARRIDNRGVLQRRVEGGIAVGLGVPVVGAVLVGSVACVAAGAVLGAAVGAISGAAQGLAEGYQAAWDNRLPGLGFDEV